MKLLKKIFCCKKEKSISFLLGAGFSAPKGYPIGNQLNEKLLTCAGDNFAFSSVTFPICVSYPFLGQS